MNRLLRRHWAVIKKEKDQWLEAVAFATVGKRPREPLRRAKLRIIRHSARAPDYDGMCAAAKFLVDPLVRLGILQDDNMEVIGAPHYEWQKAKMGMGFVEVYVEEIPLGT